MCNVECLDVNVLCIENRNDYNKVAKQDMLDIRTCRFLGRLDSVDWNGILHKL